MNIMHFAILADTYITHKIQKEKINMNNKRIMKATSAISLLVSLALTACGMVNAP